MPGKYGAIQFVIGAPTEQKPIEVGACVECKSTCYRQTFIVGKGWIWRCYVCDPVRPHLDRHRDRDRRPMSYVPAGYDRIAKAERTNADLKAGNKVARRGDGSEVSGFRVRVH